MIIPSWSEPYCGITHLGTFSTQTAWVTVEAHRKWSELTMWVPGCGFNPTHKTFYGRGAYSRAKKAGEKWLKTQHGYN